MSQLPWLAVVGRLYPAAKLSVIFPLLVTGEPLTLNPVGATRPTLLTVPPPVTLALRMPLLSVRLAPRVISSGAPLSAVLRPSRRAEAIVKPLKPIAPPFALPASAVATAVEIGLFASEVLSTLPSPRLARPVAATSPVGPPSHWLRSANAVFQLVRSLLPTRLLPTGRASVSVTFPPVFAVLPLHPVGTDSATDCIALSALTPCAAVA